MSAFDELHSQQSKVKGVAGMKQNVKSGYRAGGKAPYGYHLKKIEVGKHRTGNPITKTKLEPDQDTAPIAKEYFERRAKYESRKSILEDFYNRGIPSPSGNSHWGIPSAKSIEDNIEVYLGHTVFNRHNERIKEKGKANGYLHGKKYKPKEEWVIKKNTHEPLITEDIASIIREMKEKRIRETPSTAKKVYALSGTMKCSGCGTNYVGDRGIYRCNSRTKPGDKCPNNDISQNTAEDAIFMFMSQKILNFKNVKGVIDRLKERFHNGKSDIQPLEKNLAKIEKQQQNYMYLYSRGLVEIEDIEPKLASIKEQKKAITEEIENQKTVQGAFEVSDGDIRRVIENFTEEVSHADPKIRRSAILALFQEIRIFPKEGTPWERILEIKGSCLPLTRVSLASPRGFEPLLPA
ncbi:MAG: recombinase family protein [Proteobacteria bacterium]|nr:recombinase family protein [Pseudomonadota bacterium]